MKIINFSVNNYRCISGGLAQNTINFDGSNTVFIFGQNNAGKSSVLYAYQLFYENDKPKITDFCNKNPSNPIIIEIEVEFTIGEKDGFGAKKDQAEKRYFYGADNNLLKLRKEWSAVNALAKDLTYEPSSNKFIDVSFAGIGAHNVFKELLPTPIFIEAMPTEEGLATKVNEILSIKVKEMGQKKDIDEYRKALDAIRAYQKFIYGSDEVGKYKEEVNKRFATMFPEIRLNITENDDLDLITKAITKSFTLEFDHIDEDNNTKKDVPSKFANIGHGAIRTALFNLFLLEDIATNKSRENRGKSYIVLFEEPELFLHPKLTKQLRELIYEVSAEDTPFQVVCASHSPQMIDLTKPKTSIVRMVKSEQDTHLYQVNEELLTDETSNVKEEIYVALRFNPFMCESFYADEVILVEGDTEAVLLRGYLQSRPPRKDLFVVNCGTISNIPFFQEIFNRFNITYHVIFDCDERCEDCSDINTIKSGIQKTILEQYCSDKEKEGYTVGTIHVHHPTLEPEHHKEEIPKELQYPDDCFDGSGKFKGRGKPIKADAYWKTILKPNLEHSKIDTVPIIAAIKSIIAFDLGGKKLNEEQEELRAILTTDEFVIAQVLIH